MQILRTKKETILKNTASLLYINIFFLHINHAVLLQVQKFLPPC